MLKMPSNIEVISLVNMALHRAPIHITGSQNRATCFLFAFDFSSFFRQFTIYCYRAKLVDFDEERSCFLIRDD